MSNVFLTVSYNFWSWLIFLYFCSGLLALHAGRCSVVEGSLTQPSMPWPYSSSTRKELGWRNQLMQLVLLKSKSQARYNTEFFICILYWYSTVIHKLNHNITWCYRLVLRPFASLSVHTGTDNHVGWSFYLSYSFSIMVRYWTLNPEDRPTFKQLNITTSLFELSPCFQMVHGDWNQQYQDRYQILSHLNHLSLNLHQWPK